MESRVECGVWKSTTVERLPGRQASVLHLHQVQAGGHHAGQPCAHGLDSGQCSVLSMQQAAFAASRGACPHYGMIVLLVARRQQATFEKQLEATGLRFGM